VTRVLSCTLLALAPLMLAGCRIHPVHGPVVHPAPVAPVAPVVVAHPPAGPVVIQPDPPPPKVVVRPACPGPHHAWVDGHWDWNGHHYVWHDGHWDAPPRRGAVWVAGGWKKHGTTHVYVKGYWK